MYVNGPANEFCSGRQPGLSSGLGQRINAYSFDNAVMHLGDMKANKGRGNVTNCGLFFFFGGGNLLWLLSLSTAGPSADRSRIRLCLFPPWFPACLLSPYFLLAGSNGHRLPIDRGRHLKCYRVITITLRYDFALSHNAFLQSRTVITSNSYRSVNIGPVIASYSYSSDVIG